MTGIATVNPAGIRVAPPAWRRRPPATAATGGRSPAPSSRTPGARRSKFSVRLRLLRDGVCRVRVPAGSGGAGATNRINLLSPTRRAVLSFGLRGAKSAYSGASPGRYALPMTTPTAWTSDRANETRRKRRRIHAIGRARVRTGGS